MSIGGWHTRPLMAQRLSAVRRGSGALVGWALIALLAERFPLVAPSPRPRVVTLTRTARTSTEVVSQVDVAATKFQARKLRLLMLIALLLVSSSEERLGGQELLDESEGFLAESGLLEFLLAPGLTQLARDIAAGDMQRRRAD